MTWQRDKSGLWLDVPDSPMPPVTGPATMPLCKCGEAFVEMSSEVCETSVGFDSGPEGHDHDDNCMSRTVRCPSGHKRSISIRRACPNPECDWKGQETCRVCGEADRKLDAWPDLPVYDPFNRRPS